MPDTAPGLTRHESGWPGHWEGITREEYNAAQKEAGYPDGMIVYSTRTQADPGDRYTWTAWGLKDGCNPLIAFEAEGCSDAASSADCPGEHRFWRFVYQPELEEDGD